LQFYFCGGKHGRFQSFEKRELISASLPLPPRRFREKGLAGFGIAELTIDDDLNEAHRDNPGTGCGFSALATEIARSDQPTRALTSEQVRNDIQLIAALHPAKDTRTARSRATLTFSALVGAMALTRAISDEALSREILNTVAELLTDSA
jgi:TetR/AcrR family transcriptional regulator, transcriptional repressor for nem operon